jgi:hypothetical protein
MTDSKTTGGVRPFRFGITVPIRTDLPTWRDRVRRFADSGYSTPGGVGVNPGHESRGLSMSSQVELESVGSSAHAGSESIDDPQARSRAASTSGSKAETTRRSARELVRILK